MTKFSPQLVMPNMGDRYYNTPKGGGFNPCILGNPKNRQRGLNVLPNCVGYAVGRFNAIGKYGDCRWLGNTNAANFITLAKKQHLHISQRPTLGGCMVWKGGNTGEGHVAIVELDLGNRVVTSESEYYGKPFTIYTRSGTDWRDGCYWMGNSYTYLGCIVNPAVTEEDEKVTYEQFKEFMKRYEEEKAKEAVDGWAAPYVEECKKEGIMVGDPDGNFRGQSPVRREELAVVAMALLNKLKRLV